MMGASALRSMRGAIAFSLGSRNRLSRLPGRVARPRRNWFARLRRCGHGSRWNGIPGAARADSASPAVSGEHRPGNGSTGSPESSVRPAVPPPPLRKHPWPRPAGQQKRQSTYQRGFLCDLRRNKSEAQCQQSRIYLFWPFPSHAAIFLRSPSRSPGRDAPPRPRATNIPAASAPRGVRAFSLPAGPRDSSHFFQQRFGELLRPRRPPQIAGEVLAFR